jgi:hypothetical protein
MPYQKEPAERQAGAAARLGEQHRNSCWKVGPSRISGPVAGDQAVVCDSRASLRQ